MNKNLLSLILLIFFQIKSFSQGSWTQKASNQFTTGVAATVGFSIGDKGYVGTGANGGLNTNSFWEYDTTADAWSQKAVLPGGARDRAIGFSIGTKGYIGSGLNSGNQLQDFWEYDQSNNAWVQKANFAGGPCYEATGFSTATKGYIVNGNALWEYDPSLDQWTAMDSFPGVARSRAIAFVVGNKAYYGMGLVSAPNLDELWEYDIANNSWSQKATIPSTPNTERDFPVAFSIGNYGYVGTGRTLAGAKDFWQYNTTTDSWLQMTDFPAFQRFGGAGFSIGDKGYLGFGSVFNTPTNDLYEFTPPIGSTGIENKFANADFSIFPNPFRDYAKLEFSKASNILNCHLLIFSIDGKSVRVLNNISNNKIIIERENLNEGIYFFELSNEKNEIITRGKLIVQD